MNTILHIRRHVFGVTQVEMARIAGVRQSTVSRWENGKNQPSLPQLRRIRQAAHARRLRWDDRCFFVTESPPLSTGSSPLAARRSSRKAQLV